MKIHEVIQLLDAPATGDAYVAGDPQQSVQSILVTFTATSAVLEKAVDLGVNLVITHEPTYYNDDHQDVLAGDPIYQAKRRYIETHGLAIWRCHDWWHAFPGDGILIGMTRQFGWDKHQVPGHPEIFDLPERPLDALVGELKAIFDVASLKVIGNPASRVRRVALSVGSPLWHEHRRLLNIPGVDVLICGEQREWETCEYVRDAITLGLKKSLIVLGHCNSEEGGMQYLAQWLQQQVRGVPIHFIPAGDPFRYL